MTKSNQSSLDIADHLSRGEYDWCPEAETRLREQHDLIRQQQNEIEYLKNANRFIKNFAEEQHKRAVAFEMRELTDEEIWEVVSLKWWDWEDSFDVTGFARAILRKAQEK